MHLRKAKERLISSFLEWITNIAEQEKFAASKINPLHLDQRFEARAVQ
jgi:hypothetical protein